MHALGHSSSGQAQQPRPARSKRGRGGGRYGGSRRGQQQSGASTGACKCYRCGQNHHASTCKFKQYECHGCHRKGHLRSMCRSKVRFLDTQMSGEEEEEEEPLGIFHTNTPVKASKEPWSTTMVIDQVPVRMEIDTGSGKSLIGKDIWKQSFPRRSWGRHLSISRREASTPGYLSGWGAAPRGETLSGAPGSWCHGPAADHRSWLAQQD